MPDLCVFLTGPNYDWIIETTFSGVSFEPIGDLQERVLAKVNHPALQNAYRTYHPGYLWRSGRKGILDEVRSLVPELA
jgi:hypothetical protein